MKENNEIEEKIKIAQIIGKWVGGGVEAVVMNYYRNIDHSKIQFDFFCDEDSTNIPYEEIEKYGGKVILIPPYQKIFEYQKILKKELKKENYKIIHSHINTLSVFPLYAAKKVGIPIRIAHSHSTTNKKEWKRNIIKQLLRPFSKIYATDYMACSEHAGRWLFGNRAYDEGKVYLLNNAIDVNKFKYDENIRNKKRNELKIEKDTLVIGHVGRFVTTKNHAFLVNIFNEMHKKNKNTMLILIGKGPLENSIKKKISMLGIEDSVKLLGQINNTNEIYQAFDILILPSLYEGLGMVAIEAQCSGCPCICSRNVPKETKISDIIEYVDLNDDVTIWINKIYKYKNIKRKSYEEETSKNGYNVYTEVKKLEEKYKSYYQ